MQRLPPLTRKAEPPPEPRPRLSPAVKERIIFYVPLTLLLGVGWYLVSTGWFKPEWDKYHEIRSFTVDLSSSIYDPDRSLRLTFGSYAGPFLRMARDSWSCFEKERFGINERHPDLVWQCNFTDSKVRVHLRWRGGRLDPLKPGYYVTRIEEHRPGWDGPKNVGDSSELEP